MNSGIVTGSKKQQLKNPKVVQKFMKANENAWGLPIQTEHNVTKKMPVAGLKYTGKEDTGEQHRIVTKAWEKTKWYRWETLHKHKMCGEKQE